MTTLLAVDDSNTMRKVLEITFAGEDDLEVALASSADEALAALGERRPSLALVDVTLTGTDGYGLCEQLKQRAPGLRVVLLSSKQNPYDPSRGAAAGADDHVDKPFDTQALIDRVRTLLETAPVPVVENPVIEVVEEAPESAPPVSPPAARPAVMELEPLPEVEQSYDDVPEAPPQPLVEPRYPSPPAQPTVSDAIAAVTVRPDQTTVGPAAPRTASQPAVPRATQATAASAVAAAGNGHGTLGDGTLGGRLQGLGLNPEQVEAVLALSREVIEQAVWEVVPALAETLIKEEIARLTRE